jgi:uncharacterized protein HemY
MRKLVIFFIILLLAVALGLFIHNNPGYVLISVGNTHVQTTFWFAVIATLVIIYIWRQLSRLWHGTLNIPERYHRFVTKRRQLKKQRLEADEAQRQSYLDKLAQLDQTNLEAYWQALPKKYQKQPPFIAAYARSLIQQGQHAAAEKLLVSALKQHWDAALLMQYARVVSADPAKQLARAEKWLTSHKNDANLLSCLGHICLQNQLWGKAKQYLEASIQLQPTPLAYQGLAQVVEKTEGELAALDCYKDCLRVLVNT